MIEFALSNGVKMPSVGLGTFLMQPDKAEQAVYDALKMGYRMVDTANGYLNERAVGRRIKKSGVPREEIFLAIKLWPTVYENPGAVDKCLELLDTDYIDLLYIHQPSGNYLAGYKLLEAACKAGKVKAIGISNFHDEKLEDLLAHAEIKPHVIQLESHPYYTDTKTMDRLKEYGTRMVAWYPLGHGDKALLNEPVFTELAKKYGKPVIAFAGSVTKDAAACNAQGIDAFFPILRGICTLEQAMLPENAKSNMVQTVEQVFRLWNVKEGN